MVTAYSHSKSLLPRGGNNQTMHGINQIDIRSQSAKVTL